VERERELDTLDALIAEASAANGQLALIEGPAGVGKTQLLTELRERSGVSMTVLVARASELEREFGFGVVRQLFEAALTEQALAGAAGAAEPVFAGGQESGSFAALHGLFWLALNLAEQRPLLLAIDDLQWCDLPSLRFIAYLARRLEGARILVAATRRTSDQGTDPALLADLAGDPVTVVIRPSPLHPAGVESVVRARLGENCDPAFYEACHRSTGGNPLLLRQLLSALESDGVEPTLANAGLVAEIGGRAVSRSVLPRLARLPEDARAVARAIAVLGEGARLPVVAALAGVSERAVAEATGALTRAEVVRAEPPLGFVHPLVRDAVYNELSPAERSLEHATAARLLHEAGAPADQVAAQLLYAPPRGEAWVVALMHEAGNAAKARGAGESAVAYLQRALAEPPGDADRTGLLFDLGQAATLTSAPVAIESLERALEGVEDFDQRVRAATDLSRLYCFSETPERGLEVAREAAAAVGPDRPDAARMLEAAQYMTAFFTGGAHATLAPLEGYRAGIDAPGAGARMIEAMAAYVWMLQCGPADQCAALALRSLRGSELIEHDDTFFTVAAMTTLIAADREEAVTLWEDVKASAHRRGSLFSMLGINLWSSFTLLRRGDLTEAEPLVRRAMHENLLWGIAGGPGIAYVYGVLGELLVERGDLAGAERVVAEAPPLHGPTDGENFLRRARVELALAQGDADRALAAADDYARMGSFIINPAYSGWRSLRALALARAGRIEEALADARAEVELARQFGAPRALGRALRILGTLEGETGGTALQESVDVLSTSPAKLEHAKALAALGSLTRRSGSPREAREPLRQALELAAVCGAEPVVEFARSELGAAGARPRAEALHGVGSLTPSELRVAGYAADGETNKAIAQILYVTPKTVEVHLSNVYRKLGIRSRRELAEALAV
jgi:DNA-binding CsgD family transcriptional regulator